MNLDKNDIEEMIKNNIGLVYLVVRKYINRGLEFDDLFSEGQIGLFTAIKNYDETKGTFSSYAYITIEGRIKRAIYNNCFITAPETVVVSGLKFFNLLKTIEEELNRKLSLEEMTKLTNYSIDDIKIFFRVLKPMISLNKSVLIEEYGFEESGELINYIPDIYSIEEDIEEKESNNALSKLVFENEKLTQKQKDILFYRYGFDGSIGKTLDEVGKILNISGECVRIHQQKAEKILKKQLRKTEYSNNRKYKK